MNKLADLKSDIATFWDFEEDKRESIIKQIVEYSSQKDVLDFSIEVRDNFDQKDFSGISVIYEALTANPEKWGPLFLEEYQRAFQTATTSNEPFKILACLEELGVVDADRVTCRNEIVEALIPYISSENDVIRHQSIWFIADWISKKDMATWNSVVNKLQEKLEDKNWKVRSVAKFVLQDLGELPSGFKTPLIDQLRAKFSDPFDIS